MKGFGFEVVSSAGGKVCDGKAATIVKFWSGNKELDWKIDGLKLFLINMSREFKWQADQLILVEKMIPYAIALGYIDQLMEQIKIHYPDYQPAWYIGSNPYFTIHTQMFNAFSNSVVTTAPSSSSGFSGGGFSGGGGGGGGGGSW